MTATAATAASGRGQLPQASRSVLRRLEWRMQQAVNTPLAGRYRSVFRGKGMEFDQVVKYQWGDDLRDIDWNVTARLGEPYRKKFVEERELSLIFVFEDTPALQFGSGDRSRRDVLMELAGLLMLLGSINRDRIGMLYCAPDQQWFQPPVSGRRATLRTASRLLGMPLPALDGAAQADIPWRLVRRAASSGSVVVWLGAFAPADLPPGWRVLQQRCRTIGVRADDAWDQALPRNMCLSTYDPVAGRVVNIDTASVATQRGHAHWKLWRELWFEKLFPASDTRLKAGTQGDTLQALLRHFQQQAPAGRAR